MNTYTQTHTYTKTDVRKVFENFGADLTMLASRTQAMTLDTADKCTHDVILLAQEDCLDAAHVQLLDQYGGLVKAHRYRVEKQTSGNPSRPGGNKWPCLPNGRLTVILFHSNQERAEKLQQLGKLEIDWTETSLSTDYSGMRNDGNRTYASNGYSLPRDTFTV